MAERTAGGGELSKEKAREEKTAPKEKREDFREKLKEAVKPPEPTPEEKKATAQAFAAEMPEKRKTATVSLSSLQENPDNKRRDFGDLKGMAASMESHGVLQRLLVRPSDREGKFQIIFGHRRFRAAKLAGLKEVPIEICDVADSLALESQLIENVQRKDVTALEEAETYEMLRTKLGYSVDQVSARVGKSKGWVYARLKLLSCCPEARRALADGRLIPSVGVAIGRIKSQAKQAEATSRILSAEMTERAALSWLQGEFTKTLKAAPFDLKDEMLVPAAGSCTKCPYRSGSTPGLFDDLKGQGFDSCTNVPCFNKKVQAAWEKKTASAAKAGARVLSPSESKRVFHGENLAWNSDFVKADAPAEGDKKKRTWSQLVAQLPEEKRPALTIAANGKLAPTKLLKKEEVLKALAEGGQKWAAKAAEETGGGYSPEENERRTREREVRQETIRRCCLRAGEKIRKLDLPELRVVAFALARESREPGVLEAISGLDEGKATDWLEKKAEPADLARVIFTYAALDLAGNGWNEFSDDFKHLAKTYEVPVSDVQKEVEAENEREAAAKKAEEEKAKPASPDEKEATEAAGALDAEGEEMIAEMEKKTAKKKKPAKSKKAEAAQ